MSSTTTDDRRERKTRSALLSAFVGMVTRRRYDDIQVSEIAETADIGRSTFYAHYRDKDELLFDSMGWFFATLASACGDGRQGHPMPFLTAHIWENRAMGRRMISGPRAPLASPRGVRRLADAIEQQLAGEALALPARLLAMQIAEAQLGLLRAWILGDGEATPTEIAEALSRTSRAMATSAAAAT